MPSITRTFSRFTWNSLFEMPITNMLTLYLSVCVSISYPFINYPTFHMDGRLAESIRHNPMGSVPNLMRKTKTHCIIIV